MPFFNGASPGWKNKGGTGDRSCPCGSWKVHWLIYSDAEAWPTQCANKACDKPPTLGGHVYNGGSLLSREEYIVPLCDSCNKLTSTFTIRAGTYCASANKSETCEQ